MEKTSFITPDGTRLIEVPYFLRNAYIKQNYFELPRNRFFKRILIYFYFKFLRSFWIILKILVNSKFHFSLPKNYKIMIFDKEGCEPIYKILKNKSCFILVTRIENLNEIFLSPKIISYVISNFTKRSLRLNYLFSLISVINPQKVITFNDHSPDFHLAALTFKNTKIKFIGVQQAGRSEPDFKEKYKNFYIPNYFTFGDYEKDIKKNKINNDCNYKAVGSLKASLALQFIKEKNININKKLYDICLISEPRKVQNRDFANFNKMNQNRSLIVDHVFRFSKENNKKIIFSGKADLNSKIDQDTEYEVYKHFIPNTKFKISFNSKDKYGTYLDILQSELIIGSVSTMLQEALGYKKKVLYFDFEGNSDLYPPINGISTLKDKSYNSFEKKVREILNLDFQNYLKTINNDIDYFCYDNSQTLKLLDNELNN